MHRDDVSRLGKSDTEEEKVGHVSISLRLTHSRTHTLSLSLSHNLSHTLTLSHTLSLSHTTLSLSLAHTHTHTNRVADWPTGAHFDAEHAGGTPRG